MRMGLHWQFLVAIFHIILVVKGEAEADAEAQQYGGPGYGNRQAYPTSDMSNANMGPYGTLNNIQPSGNIRPLPANYGNMRYMQPPMMQPPMMQPPMMQPPMMQPPMMQPPVMQPPVMQPPIMQPPIMQPPVSSSGCGGNIDTGCSSKPVSSEPYQTYTYPEQVVPQENPLPEITENEEQPIDMTSYTTVQQQPYMNQQMMPFTKSYTAIPGTNCMNKCSVRPNYQARPTCRPVCNRRPLCRMNNPTPVPQVDYNIQGQTMYCNPQPSRCKMNTCGWGGSGYNQGGDSWSNGGSGYNPGGDSWSNGGSGYNPGGDSWSNGGSGYNPGGDSWTNGGSGYNPGGDVVYGGSGYNPGGDVIYNGNEGYNPGYTAQQPIYNQAPVYSAPSFYQPSSGCGSSMGCGNNMMPQPMPMTRPCGSGGCPNPPVYQAGNAVTLPARMPAPVSAAQPAAPGMPPPADIDAADSSADESSSDAAE